MTPRNACRQEHQERVRPWFIFLFCGLCLANSAWGAPPNTDPKTVSPTAAQTLLSPEKMREDLDYTVKILRNVHPATYHGFSDEQQAVPGTKEPDQQPRLRDHYGGHDWDAAPADQGLEPFGR